MNKLHLYSIMYPDTDHIEEICEDIHQQYLDGVADCPLFEMTLVPEDDPPVDKAAILCNKYLQFKKKLDSMGIKNGVLVQASIGHGWVLGKQSSFQKYTTLTDGTEDGVVCPYDKGFRDYIYKCFQTIAKCKPDHIMLDDDFRLLARGGGGCTCPLHMERLSQLAGATITREILVDAIQNPTPENLPIRKGFIETQKESLIQTAYIMREGIDSIDPSIPGSFCCVGPNAENAAEIAAIMAGKGNPAIVRINNARYVAQGTKYFTDSFFAAACQIAKLRDKVDILLAETDTCPQNRYSTSAYSLHTHFTGSILEGAKGAKHWITRLSAFEPQSGRAYRKILGKYRQFYEVLGEITDKIQWQGLRIPVTDYPYDNLNIGINFGLDRTNGWGHCVFERFGLPMYFSHDNGGVLCLEGDIDVTLSDEEIQKAFEGTVLLSSDSAQRLIARGFREYIGTDVEEWHGKQPTREKILVNGNMTKYQMKIKQLIPSKDAVISSEVYHSVDDENFEYLFPGAVLYKNSLGGHVITFCGTPNTVYNLIEAFSFLNYSRKQQFISLLSATGDLPVYYPGDEEVYLKAGTLPDGSMICGIFNLGLDPIEELKLVFSEAPGKISTLSPEGRWLEVDLTPKGKEVSLPLACYTLNPVILRIV